MHLYFMYRNIIDVNIRSIGFAKWILWRFVWLFLGIIGRRLIVMIFWKKREGFPRNVINKLLYIRIIWKMHTWNVEIMNFLILSLSIEKLILKAELLTIDTLKIYLLPMVIYAGKTNTTIHCIIWISILMASHSTKFHMELQLFWTYLLELGNLSFIHI